MSSASLDARDWVVRGFWRSLFEASSFGREVFNGDRVFLPSAEGVAEYVEWCARNRAPAWMSVQPFSGRGNVCVVEKLFFDFDSEDLVLAWKEASQLAEAIRSSYGAEPLVCFSGSRGYHVYVWLHENGRLDSSDSAKRFYRMSQELLLKGLSFKTLDRQVLGDVKRLARIPYSIHEKSLKQCAPVNLIGETCFLDSVLQFRNQGLSLGFCRLCIDKIEQRSKRIIRRFIPQGQKGVRFCIEEALKADLVGVAGHSVRIAAAAELLNLGYSVEQTAEQFKNQSDFSLEKSLYYVRDILARGYRPFKCETIRRLGFCVERCPRRRFR